MGRGAQQHQAAAALLPGQEARPLPLQPELRDPPPEHPRRGQCGSGRGEGGRALRGEGEHAPLTAPQVLSQHQAPYSVAPDSRIYADNTDLSIDRCPFSEEAGPGAELTEQQPQLRNARKGRRLEARPRRGRPGCGSWVSQSKRVPQDLTLGKDGRPPPRTVPTSQAPVSSGTTPSRGPTLSFTTRTPHPHPRTRVELPRLSTGQPLRQREVPARPEGVANRPELLPALPGESSVGSAAESGADGQEGAAGRPRPTIVHGPPQRPGWAPRTASLGGNAKSG